MPTTHRLLDSHPDVVVFNAYSGMTKSGKAQRYGFDSWSKRDQEGLAGIGEPDAADQIEEIARPFFPDVPEKVWKHSKQK